jgi:UDP-N-acetyl-D-mannosaminuronic acid dehydrogenase
LIADKLGIDVWELIRLANHHPRVNILQPGPGVGGHCIAVDPWFIVNAAPEEARLIKTSRTINDEKSSVVARRIIEEASATPGDISLLGLTFKADIDDARESPAVRIAASVAHALPDRRVIAVEPHLDRLPEPLSAISNVKHSTSLGGANGLVVLLVPHRAFAEDCSRLVGHSSFMTFVDTSDLLRHANH